MRVTVVTTLAACLLSLLLATTAPPVVYGESTASDEELVLLVSLSRHGSRAPNPTVKAHCPNNEPNMKAYQVPPEQLTERGMMQMEAAGRHVREVYVGEKKFLSSSFNSDDHSHFETYFRADAATRCGQSAISFGYGLYPDGTGPAGYAKQPIPVFMQLWENEHDFTANGPCWSVMNEHAMHYSATRGTQLVTEHAEALASIAEICGKEFFSGKGEDHVVAIKDVADMFIFDQDEGLAPTPGLTLELADELSQLAFQNLMERLYSTPREITTAIGGFPQLLVQTLNNAAAPNWSRAKSTKYFSFHGHRELLHGLGLMMGMKFNFGAGMPAFNGSTALYPGTTLFFELHRQQRSRSTSEQASYFINLFVWSPQSPRTAVKLDNCAMDCPLQQFTSIIQTHIAQTGTWQDICDYHPVNIPRAVAPASEELKRKEMYPPLPARTPETLAQVTEEIATIGAAAAVNAAAVNAAAVNAAAGRGGNNSESFVHWALTAGGFSVLGAFCATTFQRMNKRREKAARKKRQAEEEVTGADQTGMPPSPSPSRPEARQPRMSAIAFLLQATPWIPLDVRRGNVADVSVCIRPEGEEDSRNHGAEECLVWQFELEEYDIGFQMLENGAPVHDLVRYKASVANEDGQLVKPNPAKSRSSSFCDDSTVDLKKKQQRDDPLTPTWVEDRLDNLKQGCTYTFRWDNAYSLVRHKRLQYRFLVTSRHAFAAAETAAQEANAKYLVDKKKNRWTGALKPRLARKLARERALGKKESEAEQSNAIETLKQCVIDLVSSFMAKPDSPLHEGPTRAFILALETVLRNGIKESFLNEWPEEPYYEFLLETGTVLRDDHGLVAEVKALEPLETLRFIGWGRARAFLFLALNKKLLHRAFENLTKRRMFVEKYYEPHALLFNYANATQIASFLSALNAVTFLLAPFSEREEEEAGLLKDLEDQVPPNLFQCAPEAPLLGSEKLEFNEGINADSSITRGIDSDPDQIKHLQNCSLPRYLLHEQPFHDFNIGRGSVVHVPLALKANLSVLVIQLQVLVQDINVCISFGEDRDLTKPVLISASDLWTEGIFRVKTKFKLSLSVKLDNSFSIVRAKQVKLRYRVVSDEEYSCAWEACVEMARLMSWKRAASIGAERCAQYMDSIRLEEEKEILVAQRSRDAAATVSKKGDQQADEDSILGIPTSLISNPVSYFVGGILSSDPGSACAQCMTPFSFFSRQHQCPACQSIVCIPCSRHYVQLNGKGPQVKTCDRCFLKEKDNERKRNGSAAGQSQEQSECAKYAALRRDPAMDKYFKMLGFGVPASGIAQKMMQDNVEMATIEVFSAGPSGPNTDSLAPLARRESVGSRRLNRRGSSVFRKVHWTSLETKKASESIWTRVTARRKTAPITLSPHDFQELEHLFGDSTSATVTQNKEKKIGSGQKRNFSALDSRRSNNISIGLSQFKALGGVEKIISSLKSCDFEFLTAERLSNLYEIAPTSVEVKRYTDFRGSRARLETAERFLVEMCEISRVTEKVAAMLFASQFHHQQRELRDRIQAVTRACDEILHSERLARCFELVLTIGNLLNSGTELGDASGVTLASLLKLSETKSVDRTTTLLQFIIKLIHDRGEGDILLFINDLSSLADAKRFSNLICISQFKALQSGILQIENEIKEEMVSDLQRFRKEEQRRREQLEQPSRGGGSSRHPPLFNGAAKTPAPAAGGALSSSPRSSLFAAIRQRNVSDQDDQEPQQLAKEPRAENGEKPGLQGPTRHSALMEAIKKQQQPVAEPENLGDTQAVTNSQVDSRSGLMDALKNQKQQAPSSPSSESTGSSDSNATNSSDGCSALMESIVKYQQRQGADQQHDEPASNAEQKEQFVQPQPENPRAALLAAIQKRNDQPTLSTVAGTGEGQAHTPAANGGNSHTALLASIRKRQEFQDDSGDSPATNGSASQTPPPPPPSVSPQAALLAAVKRGRSKQSSSGDEASGHADTNPNSTDVSARYVPREYTMDSKFIADMRRRLLEIKSAYEDLEMELETMNSVWESTARYLGEDPSASSSEYIFSLLNRFRLDVKVVKSLLFRKGLSFASDLQALLPNAHVGNMIATIYGPGVVTALRVVDKRIEVKFPWSREAYLSPNCILSTGSLVRCHLFGVGIIRETRFDAGFCCVRFPFGYGLIQVRDIGPETSSSASGLRNAILRTPFCVGDPVLTPFGCGHIRRIQKRYSKNKGPRVEMQPDGVLEVRLLSGDLRAGGARDASQEEEDEERYYAGTAFVHLCHATLNY